MNTNKKGFTLIELLVVIVIIGILATISVATFGGYFKKARDAERQAAVQNIATIMKVLNATEEQIDYSVGTTVTDGVPVDLNTKLQNQGYSAPKSKNNTPYIYAFGNSNQDFVVTACAEDQSGTTKFFTAGTPDGVDAVTGSNCATPGTSTVPAKPTVGSMGGSTATSIEW